MRSLLIILLSIPRTWCFASFFIFVFWKCGSLWVPFPWSLLNFLDVYINHFGKFLALISSDIFCPFLSLSPGTPTMYMLVLWWCYVPQLPQLCSVFFSTFSFCLFLSRDNFHCSVFQVHWFFLLATQICLWTPLVIFFFSFHLYFSVPGFLFCFFLGFLSLLILPFYSHIIFLIFLHIFL